MNLIDIMPDLAKTFSFEDIDFLPKTQFEKNGKIMCLALPFADPRVYQDRLNAVCPGEWTSQTQITVAGSKIIAVVTVTVCGVPHTDVGEAAVGENGATEAFAQGFKRACSQVGLGRYLYGLEKQYLPYDKQKKQITLSEQDKIAVVKQMYRQAGHMVNTSPEPASQQATTQRPQVAPEIQLMQARARKLGLAKDAQEWARYKEGVLKHEVHDRDLQKAQVAALNNDLMRREREPVKA